jgi:acyl dehydratase
MEAGGGTGEGVEWGLDYEELAPGRTFETAARTVTEADVQAFAELSGDRNPMHLDPAFAARTSFGRPVAHGMLGLAVATGLVSALGLTRGTLIALVGVSWTFRLPVFYEDVVRVRMRVASRRASSRADRGLVTFAAEMLNQHGEVVQEGELVELVKRRGP